MPKKFIWALSTALVCVCTVIFIGMYGLEEQVNATAIGVVDVNGYLNVRKGPGTSYGIVKSGGTNITLSDGQRVSIIAKNGKWYHIKFKQNSKNIKGYVYITYIKVQTGSVCTCVKGNVLKNNLKVNKKASDDSGYVKAGTKNIQLSEGDVVRIYGEKIVGNCKWYYITFSYNSKKYKGYIKAQNAAVNYESGLPGILKNDKAVTLTKAAGGTEAVKLNSAGVAIPNGKQFTILAEKTVSGTKYLYVKVRTGNRNLKGYLPASKVLFQIVKVENSSSSTKTTATPAPSSGTKATATPKATSTATSKPLSDSEFKKQLKSEGFPDSYITPLMKLHDAYPYWEFKAYKTGISWGTAVKNESKVGLNLLSNSKSYAWKSTADGAYDWTTDKYIPYDGSSWVTASVKAVKYYMDPRNFLDARGIFQFESLEYQSNVQSQSGVENILNNTPMYKTKFSYTNSSGKKVNIKYSKAFMNAAVKSGVSPYHLASRSKQEIVINSTLMSSSVSGTVSGYEGIYNFYNIGANNSTVAGGAVANGLKWASSGSTYLRPWNNRYKSIVGGAKYIGSNYINVGQNTLYLEKFNVTPKNTYNHQYMGNIEAPNSEASKTVAAYGTIDKNMPITFSIPVYNNMPSTACSVPSGGKNPNNYLRTLYVKDHAFTSKFVLGDNGSKTYKTTVANTVTSAKICASKVSDYSTMTGTGTKSLSVGDNTFYVRVKSASGNTRKYKVVITRKAAVDTTKTKSKNKKNNDVSHKDNNTSDNEPEKNNSTDVSPSPTSTAIYDETEENED